MKKFSRIRYPNRRQRRRAFRQSSLSRWMAWGPLHRSVIERMTKYVFAPNPIFQWLENSE